MSRFLQNVEKTCKIKKTVSFLLRGKKWKVLLMRDKELISIFKERFRTEVEAVTYYGNGETRIIFLSDKAIKLHVIRHELFHAILSNIPTSATPSEKEEYSCDIYGYYCLILDKIARRILRKLKS